MREFLHPVPRGRRCLDRLVIVEWAAAPAGRGVTASPLGSFRIRPRCTTTSAPQAVGGSTRKGAGNRRSTDRTAEIAAGGAGQRAPPCRNSLPDARSPRLCPFPARSRAGRSQRQSRHAWNEGHCRTAPAWPHSLTSEPSEDRLRGGVKRGILRRHRHAEP